MPPIHSAIACNLDTDILSAALPLFTDEKVEAIEWSFDTLFNFRNIPDWFPELLRAFGHEGRLIGHGVFFSLFSGRWSAEQEEWLRRLERMAPDFRFDHITEHFGFMTGADFHKGAPISVPFTPTTQAIGHDRLKRIFNACRCPVGLENLAIAYSPDEVKRHGEFLERLVEPVNGFIILDLHNLFCQLHNFDIDFEALIRLYPLHRVREIHISGGSWDDSPLRPDRRVRRDTHDDAVPDTVFDLLERAIPRCPHLKFVVLEQLGTALHTAESQEQFRQDFLRMDQLVRRAQAANAVPPHAFLPAGPFALGPPLADETLYAQQMELSAILETASGHAQARHLLAGSALANTAWNVEQWAPDMLETVVRIARKWKEGFA